MKRMMPLAIAATIFIFGVIHSALHAGDAADVLAFTLRSRVETSPGSGRHHITFREETWDPAHTALIVCDVWDLHHSINAVRREEEFAPRLNEVVREARRRGVTIIHAPSGCMDSYADHPARRRAVATPIVANLPVDIQDWCSRIPAEEQGVYPLDQSDGGVDDDPAELKEWAAKLAAMGRDPGRPWKKQSDLVPIEPQDYISDRGDEVWSILESKGITHVILTGVHTNMCVLGRPFGLRQMAKNGKRVVLMRDMTDTMYNPARWPYVSHFTGTDLIIEHIEKYVCPTITSDQLIGGEPFVFKGDTRPHLVIVTAEDEYKTEQTLPKFAAEELGKVFRVTMLFGSETGRNDIPGTELIDEADLLLVSVRRRPLPLEQLERFRRFVDSGKPMVGIRTASHPFHLRDQPPPEGLAAWPEFDRQAWGGNYTGHHGNDAVCRVQVLAEKRSHPILEGVSAGEFETGGSLYKVSPVAETAEVLMTGSIDGAPAEPVAWTFARADGGRSFYTSLGHPGDFENPAFVRLLVNALAWAAGVEPPQPVTTAELQRRAEDWQLVNVGDVSETAAVSVHSEAAGPVWYRCTLRLPYAWRQHGPQIDLQLPGGPYQVWWNGAILEGRSNSKQSEFHVAPAEDELSEVNLLVVFADGATRLRCERGEAPQAVVRSAAAVQLGVIPLVGRWQSLRVLSSKIGDTDAESSILPLPAIYGASPDILFEP